MKRATVTLTALATAAIVGSVAGCSSGKPALTAAQVAHQRAVETGHALSITRNSDATARPAPQLRLGVLAVPSDTTGLIAIRLGYIAAKLSPSGIRLNTTTYATAAAEDTALADGAIDAAYTTPAGAFTAWQRTSHAVRIIAGATATQNGTSVVVLTVRTRYLTSHLLQTSDLVQGHLQAVTLLTTSPATAIPDVRVELKALSPSRRFSGAAFRYRATYDVSLGTFATARGLYDLALLNVLLKASGLPPAN